MDQENSNPQNRGMIDSTVSDLFTVTPSKNEECFTVIFHSKDVYDEIADKLTDLYEFKEKSNSAITAATTSGDRKVVLTLYKSQKLLIQGAGGKTWR